MTKSLSDFWRTRRSYIRAIEMKTLLEDARSFIEMAADEGDFDVQWGKSDRHLSGSDKKVMLSYRPLAGVETPFPGTAVDAVTGAAAHEAGHRIRTREASEVRKLEDWERPDGMSASLEALIKNILEDVYIDHYLYAHYAPVLSKYIKTVREWDKTQPEYEQQMQEMVEKAQKDELTKIDLINLWIRYELYGVSEPEQLKMFPDKVLDTLLNLAEITDNYCRRKGLVDAKAMYDSIWNEFVKFRNPKKEEMGQKSEDPNSEVGAEFEPDDDGKEEAPGDGEDDEEEQRPQAGEGEEEDESSSGEESKEEKEDKDSGTDEEDDDDGGEVKDEQDDSESEKDPETGAEDKEDEEGEEKDESSSGTGEREDEDEADEDDEDSEHGEEPELPSNELDQLYSTMLPCMDTESKDVPDDLQHDVEDAVVRDKEDVTQDLVDEYANEHFFDFLQHQNHSNVVVEKAVESLEGLEQDDAISRAVRQIFNFRRRHKTRHSRGVEEGSVSQTRLYRAGYNDRHIYDKKDIKDTIDINLCVLVDISGSVRSMKSVVAKTVRTLATALGHKKGVKFCILAYNSGDMSGSEDVNIYRLYEPGSKVVGKFHTDGGTPSVCAIGAVPQIMRRTLGRAKDNLLVHITDGMPHDEEFLDTKLADLIRVIGTRYGIETYCLAIRSDWADRHISAMYGSTQEAKLKEAYGTKYTMLEGYEDLPDAIRDLLRGLLV